MSKPHTKQVVEEHKQWLRELFEFENCPECQRGARSHTVCEVPGIGGRLFARCKPVKKRR